jgi:hypothetical protein
MLIKVRKSPYLVPIFFLALIIANPLVVNKSLYTSNIDINMRIYLEQPNLSVNEFKSIDEFL